MNVTKEQWIKDVCEKVLWPLAEQDSELGALAVCFGGHKESLLKAPKIIQICYQRDGQFSQGGVLGLGDDGVTYCIEASRWSPLYPPIDHDGKTHEEKYKIMEAAAIQTIIKQGSNLHMQKALTECGAKGFEVE